MLTSPTRPTSRRSRRLLLAQILLRLPDQKLRRRRQTRAHPTSPQRRHRAHKFGLRVAVALGSGDTFASQHGSETAVVATGDAQRCAAVSDDKCGAVLLDWERGVFLGL